MLHCVWEGVVFAHILLQQVVPPSSADDLIVNISDVHHVHHVIVEVAAQNSTQNVECDVGPGVTHVRGVVDCGSTAVPQHSAAIKRNKLFLHSGVTTVT